MKTRDAMLNDGYGVLAGTLSAHERDQPNSQGRWFHVKLTVSADAQNYLCAIDVDSKQSNVGVMWKTVVLRPFEWTAITTMSTGFHTLRAGNASGPGAPDGKVIDYIRDTRLRASPGCLFVRQPTPLIEWINNTFFRRVVPPWKAGNNSQAATELESLLSIGQRVWVFGEPFNTGFGVHNIHQNQGDPITSQWAAENGIWQDGGTIVELTGGGLVAFLNKFSTQSDQTDSDGHPA